MDWEDIKSKGFYALRLAHLGKEVENDIKLLCEFAYEEGKKEGYEDGYAEGYDDGENDSRVEDED